MNPIQKAIYEMKSNEYLLESQCMHNEAAAWRGARMLLCKTIDGMALYNVKDEKNRCRLYATSACDVFTFKCPGLGNDGCQAFVAKGE